MRFLDTITGQFILKDPDDNDVKYAVLSHTWDSNREQTYAELRKIQKRYATECQPSPICLPVDSRSDPHPSIENSRSPSSSLIPLFLELQLPDCPLWATLTDAVLSPDSIPTESDIPLSPIWADPDLSPKIREACRVARANGYRYLWIDSCCIDKTSNSELSEAINSMYRWYAHADVCYALLSDVPPDEPCPKKDSKFRRSRWFTRGWTLQELIAPANVVFLSSDWKLIGSKHSLASLVVEITNISYNALLHVEPLKDFSVAQRLSWAARRQTTRIEDRAYSLLGIFALNMPTMYGEGKFAFRRLQEEIMRRIPDQSLFAWTPFCLDSPPQLHDLEVSPSRPPSRLVFCSGKYQGFDTSSLLAPSLNLFEHGGMIEAVSYHEVLRPFFPVISNLPASDYIFSPHGIRTQVPIIPLSPYLPAGATECRSANLPPSQWYLVVLGCKHKNAKGHLLCRICYIPPSESSIALLCCGYISTLPSLGSTREFDLLSVSPATIKRLRPPKIAIKMVYIFHFDPVDGALEVARRQPHEMINLVLLRKTRNALSALGYVVDLQGPDTAHPNNHCLTLSDNTRTITIEYQHTLKDNGLSLNIEAQVRIEGRLPDSSPSLHNGGEPSIRTRRVSWDDSCPWDQTKGMRTQQVMLSTPATRGKPLTLNLDLTFAAKDHYTVHVEVLKDWTSMTISSISSSLSQQLTRVGKRGSDAVRDYWRDAAERRGGALAAMDLKSTPRTRTTKGRSKTGERDGGPVAGV